MGLSQQLFQVSAMEKVSMHKVKSAVFLSILNEMHLSHLARKSIMPERKEACVIQALKDFSMKKFIPTVNKDVI